MLQTLCNTPSFRDAEWLDILAFNTVTYCNDLLNHDINH